MSFLPQNKSKPQKNSLKLSFFPHTFKDFLHDIFIGIIIALVSIPISMGYASVAGLPVVYGLYGSLLPILIFGLISSSVRVVFGVDAAPAALVGGMLASFGIVAETEQALQIIPVITLLTSIWLVLFFFLRADRLLKFISQPVMGGFITGIGVTIILMQVPKLFGGVSGHGEVVELLVHIVKQARGIGADSSVGGGNLVRSVELVGGAAANWTTIGGFNVPSFLLGVSTIAIILVCRKFCPKVPVQPILMFAGAAFAFFCSDLVASLGIKTLPNVERGLPHFILPDLTVLQGRVQDFLLPSLSIAVVILSETLLATSNFARKFDETINPRREIAAYALGNLSSAFCGCCPINGSVSRTGIASQFGVKSQVMSVTASIVMAGILLFGTGFIQFLPVPVLTGIVISALIGTFEFSLAHKLRRVDKVEFLIFYVAFFAVLFLGTIYGVLAGVLLATITFIFRQSKPATDFLGIVPELKGYYSLTSKNSQARPLKGVVLYKFSAPLFYANIQQFCDDILGAVEGHTEGRDGDDEVAVPIRAVVVDSGGITSIDATAAERLLALYEKLNARGIKFYLAGHVSSVNDQLRIFGAGKLIEKRVVRARILYALTDAGFEPPYTQEMVENDADFYRKDFNQNTKNGRSQHNQTKKTYTAQLAEFDWAFGKDSEKKMTEIARRLAEEISQTSNNHGEIDIKSLRQKERQYSFGYWDDADEDEFLDILELQLELLREQGTLKTDKSLDEQLMQRHIQLEELLMEKKSEIIEEIVRKRWHRDAKFKENHPKAAARLELHYERYFEELVMRNPELAKELADIIAREESISSSNLQ